MEGLSPSGKQECASSFRGTKFFGLCLPLPNSCEQPGPGKGLPCCPGWPHPRALAPCAPGVWFWLGCHQQEGRPFLLAGRAPRPSQATSHPDRLEDAQSSHLGAVTWGRSLELPCPGYEGIRELSQKQRLGRPDVNRDPKASGLPGTQAFP